MSTQPLNSAQLQQYNTDGFLIIRGAITEQDIQRLEKGYANNPPMDGTLDPNAPVYPKPGRYTLATSCAKDPDLGFIIEHPAIIDPVEQLLGDDPKLTAYVIYDRTPEGPGIPGHHDYKRWRPVGSSMNWLFTIVPFCDFDDATGPLFVAPGSHKLERIKPGPVTCEVDPAVRPEDDDFIDPQLKRGDLLLMNMHTWHRAAGNQSDVHRVGLFNKYAAADAPPATGYYKFDSAVHDGLTDRGKRLIAVHSDRDIITTRVVLIRYREDQPQLYLIPDIYGLTLPGGPVFMERAIPDWDLGNVIASAQHHLRHQSQIELPWCSYIDDYPESAKRENEEDENATIVEEGLCRTYGYTLNDNGFPVAYPGQWIDLASIDTQALANGWELEAARKWLDPTIVRGKGLSQAQCRIDQFAY